MNLEFIEFKVPLTESQGRIHTSTATVAVLPEIDDVKEKDLDMSEIRGTRIELRRRRTTRK